jgi:hypothetical protein
MSKILIEENGVNLTKLDLRNSSNSEPTEGRMKKSRRVCEKGRNRESGWKEVKNFGKKDNKKAKENLFSKLQRRNWEHASQRTTLVLFLYWRAEG